MTTDDPADVVNSADVHEVAKENIKQVDWRNATPDQIRDDINGLFNSYADGDILGMKKYLPLKGEGKFNHLLNGEFIPPEPGPVCCGRPSDMIDPDKDGYPRGQCALCRCRVYTNPKTLDMAARIDANIRIRRGR